MTGFAFIEFGTWRDATAAIRELDGSKLDQYTLTVAEAKNGRVNSRDMAYRDKGKGGGYGPRWPSYSRRGDSRRR